MPAPAFSDLLTPARVVTGLDAATKADVIEHCAALLAASPDALDPDRLVADLHAREAQLSTGVGDGVALPHARTPAMAGTAGAIATLAAPVEWDAIDGKPVDLVVMIAGPEDGRAQHVRVLAQLSRALATTGVRDRIATAQSPDDVFDALREAEGAPS